MYGNLGRCSNCDSGVVTGDGRCSHCHGSGTNLNSDIPQCLFCNGTGVCRTCGGDGMIQLGEERGEMGFKSCLRNGRGVLYPASLVSSIDVSDI